MFIPSIARSKGFFLSTHIKNLIPKHVPSYTHSCLISGRLKQSQLFVNLNTYRNYQRRTLSSASQNNDHTHDSTSDCESLGVPTDTTPLNLNERQLCRESHQNFMLYAYNNFDFDTIIKINNQVLAPYQTYPRRKTEKHRRQYLEKFRKCISKHRPQSDHDRIEDWLARCIDLLTSQDMYSILRVRYILNYDNSFETLRSTHGIETLERFSNVQKAKEIRDKVLEERASNDKASKRSLLMRYLKINKIKFFRDQNVTKQVYEADIDWNDDYINSTEMDEARFAFVYNLPYIELEALREALGKLLSKFGVVRSLEIITDRVPPLTTFQSPVTSSKAVYQPKDKYSPLHAIVEFESAEQRNAFCNTNLRVFGILFFGRIIFPELAEYKHSLITAIYPPFKKMAGALQFIANTLVDVSDESNYEDQSHEFSTCKITPFGKRKKRVNAIVVTAEKHARGQPEESRHVSDNHIDASMLEDVKRVAKPDLDPQWIVLRFRDFKSAYFARQKLAEQLACEPRSFVSFDTKRSVFHNGKYEDLRLFRYNQDNERDITHTSLTRAGEELEFEA